MEKPCSHIGEWGFLINGYRISNLGISNFELLISTFRYFDISNIHQKKLPGGGVF